MEFRILETGPRRFVVEATTGKKEWNFPYAPAGFSELSRSAHSRIFFRDVGTASITEIQEGIVSWIKETTAPYLSAAVLKDGTVVEVKTMAELRVKSPK